MTAITSTVEVPGAEYDVDSAELAAVAFLARYSGRTLDAYRHDLRNLFQWAAGHGLPVLEASRVHLEIYRSLMEERGLAASTIDRRLFTACGFYRFAHIDGRISSNPAQYVRRPTVRPSQRRGLDRGELGRFLFSAERFDHAHATLTLLLGLNGLRVSEAERREGPILLRHDGQRLDRRTDQPILSTCGLQADHGWVRDAPGHRRP